MNDNYAPEDNATEHHDIHHDNIVTGDGHDDNADIPISESTQSIDEHINREEEHH